MNPGQIEKARLLAEEVRERNAFGSSADSQDMMTLSTAISLLCDELQQHNADHEEQEDYEREQREINEWN